MSHASLRSSLEGILEPQGEACFESPSFTYWTEWWATVFSTQNL
jgi:hypothetical protein